MQKDKVIITPEQALQGMAEFVDRNLVLDNKNIENVSQAIVVTGKILMENML